MKFKGTMVNLAHVPLIMAVVMRLLSAETPRLSEEMLSVTVALGYNSPLMLKLAQA